MRHIRSARALNARLLKIGVEVFPVYGDDESGWYVDPGDLTTHTPQAWRYHSLDELFFALVNLNFGHEGSA